MVMKSSSCASAITTRFMKYYPSDTFLSYQNLNKVTLTKIQLNNSQSARFCIVHPPMPEGTKMLRTDPKVVDHAENKYCRKHVHRWGVSEI